MREKWAGWPAQIVFDRYEEIFPWPGRFLWLELKTGSARQAPHQKARAAEWAKAGALVIVVRSVSDLEKAL